MPVKILLADKSITIQKVVEMLFSGKEYEVTCVSDGDLAFSEASRIVPDVVLADVDLPRIDGYTFSGRLRETPALAKVPVILMLSRDDVYDAMKGKLAGLVDNIAKPFESQELIGKVKKALSAAPTAAPSPKPAAEAAPAPKPVAAPPPPKPAVEPASPSKPIMAPPTMSASERAPAPPPRTRDVVPKDIFDIIDEAPVKAEGQEAPVPLPAAKPAMTTKTAAPEEEMFEVEPEYEVEPELEPEPETPAAPELPRMAAVPKATEEWAGLTAEVEPEPETAPASHVAGSSEPPAAVDAFDTDKLFGREPIPAEEVIPEAAAPALEVEAARHETDMPPSFDFSEPLPAEAGDALPLGQRAMDEMREGLGLRDVAASASDMHPDIVSFESLDMASRALHEDYTFAPQDAELASPAVAPAPAPAPASATAAPAAGRPSAAPFRSPDSSDEMLKGVAKEAIQKAMREILERVAWEVIPDLAERLIREEIERLKAETK